MTSKPLYYTNSYLTDFQSKVIEQLEENGLFGIILEQTAFYPTSGGQPHDTGTLNGIEVADVTLRPDDDAIAHWLAAPFQVGASVDGRIEWTRRFDHMQQHTGQHMLSQAFLQLAEAPTLSFHLSQQKVTIDLDIDILTPDKVSAVERYVNRIVWENRPIFVESVTQDEAEARNVRKLPPKGRDAIRLVNISDFDLTACGGTHVGATGSVGMIKVIKTEKQNQKVRVTFCCGERALADYEQKNQITNQLGTHFTTGLDDLVANMQKLQAEAKAQQKANAQLQSELMGYRAKALRTGARTVGPYGVVIHVLDDGSPQTLRTLAHALLETEQTIALLALRQAGKTNLLFCCSEAVPLNMSDVLKAVLAELASGSGGGKANMAQGGTAVSDPAVLKASFDTVLQSFLNQI